MDNLDILSEVFSALRIRSQLYFSAELRAGAAICVPEERRRIRFHLVLQGQCYLRMEGRAASLLSEGDIVLIPNGASQILSAEPDTPAISLEKAIKAGALRDGVLRGGTGVARAVLLCGFCQFDEGIEHPALADLPPAIHLRIAELGAEPWVTATLKLLALEAGLAAQGTTAILGRLIEIVVIQATRRLSLVREGYGFIAALADPHLSRALYMLHRMPEKAWRVGELAEAAGMSRARFADRFAEIVGVPPIEYLTRWRLIKARGLLSESQLSIEDIAERCGYASLPSFTRRFKAQFGVGPGTFRRTLREAAE
jgi:AraC-like DNA-binding protein